MSATAEVVSSAAILFVECTKSTNQTRKDDIDYLNSQFVFQNLMSVISSAYLKSILKDNAKYQPT